ncbi:MAG: VPLPA-CTERM sorting domain-containing protein [Pirellulaceae bacterium]
MTRWGKLVACVCAVTLSSFAGNISANIITFDVIPAYAPVGPNSPSWNGYVSNALLGIRSGGVPTGAGPDRDADPTFYQPLALNALVDPSEMIYTPFNSWRATATPNASFTGNSAVSSEFGNRIHFGLHVVSEPGSEFALNDLTWALDSNDSDDYFDQGGSFAGATYSSTRLGINYGTDGIADTADDIIYDSGEAGTSLINELVYVGVGDGFYSFNSAAASDQDDINQTLAQIFGADCDGCNVDFDATYTLPNPMGGTASGTGGIDIFVPEPASAVMVLCGLIGLGLARRRN